MVEVLIAVQPPSHARIGMTLYPPVAARFRSSNIYEQLGGYWTIAKLVDSSGETLPDRLGGRVSDSAHPMPVSTGSSSIHSNPNDRAYFYFPDLVIPDSGRYCIRISLLQMDYSSEESPEGLVLVRDYVDTEWINVIDSPVDDIKPTSGERRFLRKLKDDGKLIPSASSQAF